MKIKPKSVIRIYSLFHTDRTQQSQTTNTAAAVHTETLPCGLRIICAPSATDIAYCGIAVNAGTRDERQDDNGMAHFCEHLTFKGTHRRRSWHILNRMEAVGGNLNAYTGKEYTIYYTAFLKEHFARVVDLLVDVVLGSTYPPTEMNKEVVIDEIESYKDSPAELIFDDFENLIFSGHPLGRNILGEAGRLCEFQSTDMKNFTKRLLYLPINMALFVYGRIDAKTVRKEVERVPLSLPEGDMLKEILLDQPEQPALANAATGRTGLPEYPGKSSCIRKRTRRMS